MTTVLIDYDSGNLHSAEKAFQRMAREGGYEPVIVTDRPEDVARASRVVLPGDGAFPACRRGLQAIDGLEEAIVEAVEARGVPFLGICVGMQMLASWGREYEDVAGFGWVPGEVVRITPSEPRMKVPHMGWNDLVIDQVHPVLAGLETGNHAYFVHSYHMQVAEPGDLLAHVDYGGPVTAIVGRDNVVGTQFHPEKSQHAGLRLISNFLGWAP
ncbi:imidazole glycerol phosphate synthase subunit HisH [Roseobacter sp. HKCCD9010]|uniref:imidazole glycerol phosphate synthase subunit HisH n=1 Tax=unclassified Roseobacter TaxID=196798 RepID=UPI00149241AD|nr:MULTISPECIES: imidazole glycerol phosphate synthase subunit HisH [unclassified Roseobacter]MBF9049482.1 imidazole glycerol phosphate synthase subunit HisH [Rhodobacterales bacterium HKCCD4356]NNV11482.1 imidazole glycerol phosphate synthase subunit HisH [Roseobacter sp. HKCCD7357]NNV15666.1 imidazole glycerol phosphate synthase subunit HisH [Roseobacter sp. HKCCD8768]NNV25126.1 imidazole glycerol phosphate synthase subunit HisH [Roseobacter sp. HKCCD8192]NNV29383.1 imidazole glycerol phosph